MIQCPSCGSDNVQSLAAHRRQKKSSGMGCLIVVFVLLFTPALVLLPFVLVAVPILLVIWVLVAIARRVGGRNRYVCLVCDHIFEWAPVGLAQKKS